MGGVNVTELQSLMRIAGSTVYTRPGSAGGLVPLLCMRRSIGLSSCGGGRRGSAALFPRPVSLLAGSLIWGKGLPVLGGRDNGLGITISVAFSFLIL